MKNNIGIWIDTSKAIIVKLSNNNCTVKTVESNIETRERVAGETKKFGRFAGQYITYEKNRQNKKMELTHLFLKNLTKEIQDAEALVLLGPANMKKLFAKEILKNMQIANKLIEVQSSDSMTENQLVARIKKFYKE